MRMNFEFKPIILESESSLYNSLLDSVGCSTNSVYSAWSFVTRLSYDITLFYLDLPLLQMHLNISTMIIPRQQLAAEGGGEGGPAGPRGQTSLWNVPPLPPPRPPRLPGLRRWPLVPLRLLTNDC